MRPTSAPAPLSPVGAMIDGTKPPNRLRGSEMICATTPKTTEMITTTPSVDQKRPRVSCHDRAIARKTGARSRMITEGTRNSLGVNQRYSGMSARKNSTPTSAPTQVAAMTSSATIPARTPTSSTTAPTVSAL